MNVNGRGFVTVFAVTLPLFFLSPGPAEAHGGVVVIQAGSPHVGFGAQFSHPGHHFGSNFDHHARFAVDHRFEPAGVIVLPRAVVPHHFDGHFAVDHRFERADVIVVPRAVIVPHNFDGHFRHPGFEHDHFGAHGHFRHHGFGHR
jgi:hypothetical protein